MIDTNLRNQNGDLLGLKKSYKEDCTWAHIITRLSKQSTNHSCLTNTREHVKNTLETVG
jgi:hypothetical protein